MISVIVALLPPPEDPQLAHRVISQQEKNAHSRQEIFLSGGHKGMVDLTWTYFNYPNAWKLSWRHIGEFDRAGPMEFYEYGRN